MKSLKFYFFLLASLSMAYSLTGQATYILFDQACMERLSFDQSRSDTRQDYVAYHISLRSGEKLILEVGEESPNEQNYLPENYLSCQTGGIDKTLVTRINSNRSQVLIVYPKNNRKYVVSPVTTAAIYRKNGNTITYESPKYQFEFDLDYGTIGENIALNNPGVKLYFEGKLTNDCAGSYLFRQLAPTSTYPLIDLVLMPEIGIVEERAGANAAAAMDNALILKEINGMAKDRYLREVGGMEPGARGALTARRVPPTPASFDTSPAALNPPIAGNLPSGAIVPGGQAATVNRPTSVGSASAGIPNQVNRANTSPSATSPTTASSATTHTVASGETLYGISRKYNVSVSEIKEWNNLNSNMIRRGQLLTVTPPSVAAQQVAPTNTTTSPALTARSGNTRPTTLSGAPVPYQASGGRIATSEAEQEIHVVQPGETVASIALTYGYTARRFREINNLGPNDYVKVGQQLKVSDCDCPPTEEVPTTSTTGVPSVPPTTTPASYGSTGGRISPSTFTARTPTSSYAPPVVSPGETATPVEYAGGLRPSTNEAPAPPPANVYNTILPTGYDAPPTSYEATTTTPRSPLPTSMSNMERRSPRIISSASSEGFGETAVVPADPRPQEYTFTPSNPYPVPRNSSFQAPTPASSTPATYYNPPTAVPESYDATTTARSPASYFQGGNNQRRVHIVHEGESLYGIARQYGITVAEIRRLNGLQPGDLIKADQSLYVE
jgi:LysM repeat protein